MIAENTNLVIRGDNLQNMVNMLNTVTDLETLSHFFKANILKLNAQKIRWSALGKKTEKLMETIIQ